MLLYTQHSLQGLSGCKSYPKKGGKQLQLHKALAISQAEESTGNMVLGVKCRTPEITNDGSILTHQSCVCLSEPGAAQLGQE